jgi:hypothetical protein
MTDKPSGPLTYTVIKGANAFPWELMARLRHRLPAEQGSGGTGKSSPADASATGARLSILDRIAARDSMRRIRGIPGMAAFLSLPGYAAIELTNGISGKRSAFVRRPGATGFSLASPDGLDAFLADANAPGAVLRKVEAAGNAGHIVVSQSQDGGTVFRNRLASIFLEPAARDGDPVPEPSCRRGP